MTDAAANPKTRIGGAWFTFLALVALAAQVHVFNAQPAADRLERKHAQREALEGELAREQDIGRDLITLREGLRRDPATQEAECRRRGFGRKGEMPYVPLRREIEAARPAPATSKRK